MSSRRVLAFSTFEDESSGFDGVADGNADDRGVWEGGVVGFLCGAVVAEGVTSGGTRGRTDSGLPCASKGVREAGSLSRANEVPSAGASRDRLTRRR